MMTKGIFGRELSSEKLFKEKVEEKLFNKRIFRVFSGKWKRSSSFIHTA